MPSSDPRLSSASSSEIPEELPPGSWLGFSLRSLLLIFLGILLFGLYVGVLLFGENSVEVLNSLHREKAQLVAQKEKLQQENQRLQKRYFELLEITGD